MDLLIVDYIKPANEVEPLKAAHGEWVGKYVQAGVFLIAGPKYDKTGGAIIAKSMDEAKLQSILGEDSYITGKVAKYTIVHFDVKATSKELEFLQGV